MADMADTSRKVGTSDPRRAEYGDRLRRARLARGITQAHAAAVLGCSARYVSDLEQGRRLEAWPAFLDMVRTLGYDPAIVAPELSRPTGDAEPDPVNVSPLVSQTRCPSTDVPRRRKKTDRQS